MLLLAWPVEFVTCTVELPRAAASGTQTTIRVSCQVPIGAGRPPIEAAPSAVPKPVPLIST